jgi:hypothetical protein
VPRTTLHIGIDLVLSAHEIADHESGSITGWKSCERPVFNNERASSAIKTAFVPVSAKARGISDALLNLNPIQLSLFSSVHNTHRPFRVPIDINELRGLSVYEVGLDVCRMVYQSDDDTIQSRHSTHSQALLRILTKAYRRV